MGDSGDLFGKSRWADREETLGLNLERWLAQLLTLIWKNSLVLLRRRLQLAALLLLPMVLVPSLDMGYGPGGPSGGTPAPSPPTSHLSPFESLSPFALDTPLSKCNIVYAPSSVSKYADIMGSVGREGGAVVTGFPDTVSLQRFVAGSLGQVQ